MKKIFSLIAVPVFVLSFSVAYAGGSIYNDLFEIGRPSVAPEKTVESSAAGSERAKVISNDISLYNDLFEMPRPSTGREKTREGSAAGSLRQNFAGKKSSVRNYYDLFEIGR